MEITIKDKKFDVDTTTKTVQHEGVEYKDVGDFSQRNFVDNEGKEVEEELSKQLTTALIRAYSINKSNREKENDGKEVRIKGETYYVNLEKSTVKHGDAVYQKNDEGKFLDAEGKTIQKEVYEDLHFAYNIISKREQDREQVAEQKQADPDVKPEPDMVM